MRRPNSGPFFGIRTCEELEQGVGVSSKHL